MNEILRNMLRRKTRSSLTILGSVIGVFAIMVMGAMSEHFNVMLDGAEKYMGSNIGISPINRDLENQLNMSTVHRLRRVNGVEIVTTQIGDYLGEPAAVSFGPPELMIGVEPEHIRYLLPGVTLQSGRLLEKGDSYHIVVGSDVASKRSAKVGDIIEWREEPFTIIGILNKTQTTPDGFAYGPIHAVRRVLEYPSSAVGSITVVPENVAEAEALARRIEREVPKIKAQSPKEAIDEVRQGLATFQVVMLSSALIAGIIGGLSVMNTMIMSVYERTREIGVKKAIGASNMAIIREYIAEAGVMGVVGGALGVMLGWLMTILLNQVAAAGLGQQEVWLVTPRLVAMAFGFAVVVGAGAGFYPAWRAASLDPVQALRME